MVELLIDRRWKKANYTIGRFFVNGQRLCESLEDTDRGLQQRMPVGIINSKKVYGKTAIPTGEYDVVLSVSPKFKNRVWAKKYGGLVPEILNVKGYTGVRIHPLTSADQTEGCPGIGDNTIVGKLTNSQKRYYELMDILVPAFKAGERIILTIR